MKAGAGSLGWSRSGGSFTTRLAVLLSLLGTSQGTGAQPGILDKAEIMDADGTEACEHPLGAKVCSRGTLTAAIQGQQGLKHTAMALGSQARPVCREECLGKVLTTLGKKTRLQSVP